MNALETVEQRIDAALRDNRNFVSGVLSAVPDFVYVYDLQAQRTLYANRATEALLGFSDQQLVDMTGTTRFPEQLNALVAVEDEALIERTMQQLMESSPGETIDAQIRLRHADGTDHWYASRTTIFERNPSGAATHILGIMLDITAQKKTDAAERAQHVLQLSLRRMENELSRSIDLTEVLQVAMDNVLRASGATDGFIGLLESGEIRVMHPVGDYQRDTRFFVEEGVIGRALRNRRPEMVDDVRKDPDYVANLNRTTAQMVWPLLHRNRILGVINLETSNPGGFVNAQPEFLRMIMSRLSTSIENAQLYALTLQQLAEKTALLERVSSLEQLKTDMIRIAAHDLRNPLSAIIGYSQLLLESERAASNDEREFTGTILRSGYKMEKIIGDILSLERIQEMQNGVPQDRVDLSGLVRTAVEEATRAVYDRSQTLTADMGDLPLLVQGDSPQLREAIDNLIGNAIKYTPEGGSITVTTRAFDDRIFVDVTDTGIGIPDDMQAKLFSPFYRAKTQETLKIEGTGLGLHLVKNIIERHGGVMHFHSVYGEGSTFGFELPLVD